MRVGGMRVGGMKVGGVRVGGLAKQCSTCGGMCLNCRL